MRELAQRIEQWLALLDLVERLFAASRELGMGNPDWQTLKEFRAVVTRNANEAALVWYREYRSYSTAVEKAS